MLRFLCFGGAHVQSTLDEFTVTTGDACPVSTRELFNGLGMAQADTWADGTVTTEPLLIDGHPLMVRREGWRLRVWSPGDEPPPADPLPPPPDAHMGARPPARVVPEAGVMFPEKSKGTPESVRAFVAALQVVRELIPADAESYDGLRAELERIAALANDPTGDAPSQGLAPCLELMLQGPGRLASSARALQTASAHAQRALDAAAVMEHARRIEIVRDVVAVQRFIEGEVERHHIAQRRMALADEAQFIITAVNNLVFVMLGAILTPYLTDLRQRLIEWGHAQRSAQRPGSTWEMDAIVLNGASRPVVERLRAHLSTLLREWEELFSLFPWDTDEFAKSSRGAAEWLCEGCNRLLARNVEAPTVAVNPPAPQASEDEAIRRELKGAILATERALEWARRAVGLDDTAGSLIHSSPHEARVVILDLRKALIELYVTRWTALGGESAELPFAPASARAAIVFARGELAECVLAWAEYPGNLPDLVQRAQRLMESALIRVDSTAFAMREDLPALTEHQLHAVRNAACALGWAAKCVGDAEHLSRSETELVTSRALDAIMAARVVVIDDVLKGDHHEAPPSVVVVHPTARFALTGAHDVLTQWVEQYSERDVPAHRTPDAAVRAVLRALVAVDRALLAQPEKPTLRRTLGRLLGRLASAVSP